MPTPRSQYNIGVKLSGGSGQQIVLFRNGRTGEYKRIMSSRNEATVNIGELSSDGTDNDNTTKSGFQNEDVIQISTNGNRFGSTNHAVNTGKGGVKITLTTTDVSSTNTPNTTI